MLRNWLRSLFSTRKNPIGRTARRRPTFRPSLEELESRLTPTIVFKPHFGAESAVDNGGFKLDRDPVNLIFWGSYWKAAVNPSENDLVNAFTSVLSGPYFKSLSQYGVNGADASIQSVISNSPDPVNGFDHGDIQDVIMNAIDNQGLAEPDAGNYDNALYVVITPPGIGSDRGSSVYGYNNCFHSGSLLDPDLAIYAWVGIPAAGNLKDVATCVFSHEVAEALTDPKQGNGISVTASPNFSASVPGYASPDQICDFEPEIDVGYTYRVN